MEKTIRTATLGLAEEFRRMSVGDEVRFPLEKYNYNSVRSTPSATLKNLQIMEGRQWIQRIDMDTKSVIVTRTA